MAKNNKTEQPAKEDTTNEIEMTATFPTPEKSKSAAMSPKIASLAAMFGANPDDEKKIKKLTLPPIVKPAEIMGGICIAGEIIDVVDSPVSTYKSKLLKFKHHSGNEFMFPATAVVKRALNTALLEEKKIKQDQITDDDVLIRTVGMKIGIRGLSKGKTQKGDDLSLLEIYRIEE